MDKGLQAIGFSGHAPVPFENNYAIQGIDSLRKYTEEISELKKKYRDKIQILLALEADFIPEVTLDFKHFISALSLYRYLEQKGENHA